MDVKRLFLLLLCYFSLQASESCFFVPPNGWEIANPEILAPRVHICFLGKTSTGLVPSINLATEAVNVSLDAYIEEIRKIHTADPNSRWRDLGAFKSLLGDGRLIEIEMPTEFETARMVQLVTIKEGVAYILTASSAKEEFSKHYRTFNQALQSLQASSSLIESYPLKSSELKNLTQDLNQKYQTTHLEFDSEDFQKEIWKPFEKKIIESFTEMGPYWQILFLKETQASLPTLRSESTTPSSRKGLGRKPTSPG